MNDIYIYIVAKRCQKDMTATRAASFVLRLLRSCQSNGQNAKTIHIISHHTISYINQTLLEAWGLFRNPGPCFGLLRAFVNRTHPSTPGFQPTVPSVCVEMLRPATSVCMARSSCPRASNGLISPSTNQCVCQTWGGVQKWVMPKSSILEGFSIIKHPFWGTPIYRNLHVPSDMLAGKPRLGNV